MVKAVKAPGEAAEASAKKAEGAFSGLSNKLRGMAGPIIAAFGAAEFWKANTGIESLRRSLELLKGGSDAAAKEIEYLRSTSNRLGLDVQEVGKAYISLTAAAKGTSLEGAQTRAIFEAVAGAMAKLGKSSADTEGALQVFERFHRVDTRLSRTTQGVGLGLYIVRVIAQFHRGTVDAADRADGQGVVIRVRLPLAAPRA